MAHGGAPTVAVLWAEHRPPGMDEVTTTAEIRYATAAELPAALHGADVLFVWDFLSDAVRGAWPAATGLRWVHTASAGVDRLLFDDLVRSQVVLTNSRGVFDRPMAEYVLGLVLAFAKDLPGTVGLQRERSWRHRETEPIEGRHAVVVGLGGIGRCIAGLLAAAGMAVSGVGRTARPGDPELGRVHAVDQLPDLLPHADYAIIAAPLTGRTRRLFDAAMLRRMKPSARLINVGRGAIVVTDDLVDAIRDGQLAGAALDVFEAEPLPADHPLWTMPGVIVSPHMSGDVVGWRDILSGLFTANFRRWVAGEPLHNVVDKELGYVATAGDHRPAAPDQPDQT